MSIIPPRIRISLEPSSSVGVRTTAVHAARMSGMRKKVVTASARRVMLPPRGEAKAAREDVFRGVSWLYVSMHFTSVILRGENASGGHTSLCCRSSCRPTAERLHGSGFAAAGLTEPARHFIRTCCRAIRLTRGIADRVA